MLTHLLGLLFPFQNEERKQGWGSDYDEQPKRRKRVGARDGGIGDDGVVSLSTDVALESLERDRRARAKRRRVASRRGKGRRGGRGSRNVSSDGEYSESTYSRTSSRSSKRVRSGGVSEQLVWSKLMEVHREESVKSNEATQFATRAYSDWVHSGRPQVCRRSLDSLLRDFDPIGRPKPRPRAGQQSKGGRVPRLVLPEGPFLGGGRAGVLKAEMVRKLQAYAMQQAQSGVTFDPFRNLQQAKQLELILSHTRLNAGIPPLTAETATLQAMAGSDADFSRLFHAAAMRNAAATRTAPPAEPKGHPAQLVAQVGQAQAKLDAAMNSLRVSHRILVATILSRACAHLFSGCAKAGIGDRHEFV